MREGGFRAAVLTLIAALAACSGDDRPPGGARDAGRAMDAGTSDAAVLDAGRESDAGAVDGGPARGDAGPMARDAGPGGRDAGPMARDAGPGGRDAGPMARDAGPGGRDAGAGGCGTLGARCAGSSDCGPGQECDTFGVCIPAGRPICGGFAGATCPSPYTHCPWCSGCDFGNCLTAEEYRCICARASDVYDCRP